MGTDHLRAKLADAGVRRQAAVAAKKQASDELAALIPRAVKAGITPAEIRRLTGVSKQGVYDFTHRAKSPIGESPTK
jgi:hypothetical protein